MRTYGIQLGRNTQVGEIMHIDGTMYKVVRETFVDASTSDVYLEPVEEPPAPVKEVIWTPTEAELQQWARDDDRANYRKALRNAQPGEAVEAPSWMTNAEAAAIASKLAKFDSETKSELVAPIADLAVAYPVSDELIGFTLTVAGKPQQFEMKRSAVASFAGRIAEALAK